ncbi:hypothetical protein BIW11_05010 [Tropilaelaps mercedesae]|uniref:Uncharacterized protein n=1 Tax=Tropilaelaps mercedesae TaxID=418985 RepID=A0A1V9WYJ8_9ACAR|nr:hypothetical protein BIW11_05010 [Tropilaelaps mercedesae]
MATMHRLRMSGDGDGTPLAGPVFLGAGGGVIGGGAVPAPSAGGGLASRRGPPTLAHLSIPAFSGSFDRPCPELMPDRPLPELSELGQLDFTPVCGGLLSKSCSLPARVQQRRKSRLLATSNGGESVNAIIEIEDRSTTRGVTRRRTRRLSVVGQRQTMESYRQSSYGPALATIAVFNR